MSFGYIIVRGVFIVLGFGIGVREESACGRFILGVFSEETVGFDLEGR